MFSSPLQGKGSVGSPVQYWKKFCRFPSPVLCKGSRFPIPILGKCSIGPTVQFWEIKVLNSQVEYWENILGSPVQAYEKGL